MTQDLQDGFAIPLTVTPKDRDGNDAAIDGKVDWASSDETLIVIREKDGVQYASTVPGPGTGPATVTATFDADLGEGRTEVAIADVINVTAGPATTGAVGFGTAVPREDLDAPTQPPTP